MFYVISVHVRGLDKSIEAIEKELIHTKVYRLTKKARNKLMAQKVSLYQWLERNSSFKVGDSYVIHESKLQEFREVFERKHQKFRELVREVHEELKKRWPDQKREIEIELRRRIADEEVLERLLNHLERLEPPEDPDQLANLSFSILPLLVRISPQNYAAIPAEFIGTLEQERRQIENEIRQQYIQRIEELTARLEELERERERLRRELSAVNSEEERRIRISRLGSITRAESHIREELRQISHEINDLQSMNIQVEDAIRLLQERIGLDRQVEEREEAQG